MSDESDSLDERKALLSAIRKFERAARPLEPNAGKRKKLRRAIVQSTETFLGNIDEQHAFRDTQDQGAALLDVEIGRDGRSMHDMIAVLEHAVVRPGANPAAAGHLAYIPGGGLYHSALGDFFAAISNKYAGVFFAGPGAVRMENMLLRWMADLVGYPAAAGGNMSSGGSIANLTAITAARDARILKGADYARAVVYLTEQAHHCLHKALRIAGMAETRIRYIPMDGAYRMRADALALAIADDQRLGFNPWLVVAAAGTTDTGAVDPLDEIATIAHGAGCWFHVDAAYGGFFLLTEHGRTMLRGIERSDSVVLDPHKSLFLPYGSGVVLVRNVEHLLATNLYSASYMQDAVRTPGEISPADVSPELTKHFRALRMWMPLVQLGTAPFEAALEEKLLLARYFRAAVKAIGYSVGPQPDLSIVTYRWAPPGMSDARANELNATIVENLRRDGRIFLSSTMIDGRYTLRMVALSFRTHKRTIDLAIQLLTEQKELLNAER